MGSGCELASFSCFRLNEWIVPLFILVVAKLMVIFFWHPQPVRYQTWAGPNYLGRSKRIFFSITTDCNWDGPSY